LRPQQSGMSVPDPVGRCQRAAWREKSTALFLEFVFSFCPNPTNTQCEAIAVRCTENPTDIDEFFACRRAMAMLEGMVTSPSMTMSAITSIESPFSVIWASDEWLSFCGFSSAEVTAGQSLKVIQGPATDPASLTNIMESVRRREAITTTLLNYTKHGIPFVHTISIEPLTNSLGEPVLFKVQSHHIVSGMEAVLPTHLPAVACA